MGQFLLINDCVLRVHELSMCHKTDNVTNLFWRVMTDNFLGNEWYSERYFHKNVATGFKIKSVLHTEKSEYQKIEVLDTHGVGRLLLLDGKTMVSDRDEFV